MVYLKIIHLKDQLWIGLFLFILPNNAMTTVNLKEEWVDYIKS